MAKPIPLSGGKKILPSREDLERQPFSFFASGKKRSSVAGSGKKISGQINDSDGIGLDGVTVALTGEDTDSVVTAGGGLYEFTGKRAGNYTVTPTLLGSSFFPTSRSITVTTADVVVGDMTQGWSISGVLTNERDQPLIGKTITLVDLIDFPIETPITTANSGIGGAFSFVGLVDGPYGLRVDQVPYYGGADVIVNNNHVNQDFVAAASGLVASGYILDDGDLPLEGVTVEATGDVIDTQTTDAHGYYEFTLLGDGTFTITPTLEDYDFAPTSREVTIFGANVEVDDFVGTQQTWTISGYIVDGSSVGIADVDVALSGDATDATVTDGHGFYTFTVIDGSYTVTPSHDTLVFDPLSANVTVDGGNETVADFDQEYFSISGVITGDEVEGVTVALSGDATDSFVTGVDGAFGFGDLSDGDYTLTPTLEGYEFTPASINVTIDGADDTDNDFVSAVAMLSLPYTYDVSTAMAAASDGDTAPSADANWVTNPSWSPWRVTGSGIADPDGYTPAGVTKMMYGNPAEGTYRVGRFALPQQVDALAGFRMAFLRRTTVSNAGGPFGQMKAFDGIPMDWTTAIPSISFSRSTDGTPKCYLETRYTTGGADQTEMNWASATDYGGGLTSTDGRYWSWTYCEMDFVNNTVKVRVKRASDDVSRYAELSQAMNANGAALNVTPKWTHLEFWHTGGAQDCLAKIWIGALTDAWPT